MSANERPVEGACEASKHDSGKLRVDLLPIEALEATSKAFAFGANKYAAWNWRNGLAWTRLYGAALRHLFAWARGEDLDPESGVPHLAHCSATVLMLLDVSLLKLGQDDRWRPER